MSELLDCLEIEPRGEAAASVIWLHGLGADARDFEPVVPLLELTAPVRFVFPNAPVRPVTINGGMRMRAWYDIDPGAPLAAGPEIRRSAEALAALVARENDRGIATSRIVLAGFSQGGVIALHLGLRHPERFGGIMALSTYLHDHEHLADEASLAGVDVPIFMAHGVHDPMIPISRAITAREALRALGYRVEWHEYPMGHQVCPEEIGDISRWLAAVLG